MTIVQLVNELNKLIETEGQYLSVRVLTGDRLGGDESLRVEQAIVIGNHRTFGPHILLVMGEKGER